MEVKTRKKVIRPGTMPTHPGSGRRVSIFCEIELDGDKLSISGVIGPTRGGNATGGCGQIDMEFKHRDPDHDDKRYDNPTTPDQINFADGWTADKWLQFLEYWKLYHLNDMRPGCEHQTAAGWGKKEIRLIKVTFDTWKCYHMQNYQLIKHDISNIDRHIKRREKTGYPITTGMLSPRTMAGRIYLEAKARAFQGTIYSPAQDSAAATWLSDHGPLKIEIENKTSGWTHPNEHPDGELTKPCPTCGYKYGTAWKKSEVPPDVIKWLFSLPDTDKTPAWV